MHGGVVDRFFEKQLRSSAPRLNCVEGTLREPGTVAMTDSTRLMDLVVRWQELREQGQAITLAELCRDCPELIEPVKEQLQALQSLASFLNTPGDRSEAAATADTMDDAPKSGLSTMAVSGYEILEELGRGGMGVVYKARQVALKRLVALKMILGGSLAGDYQRQRFRNEAEAVARLRHPNIVQIYDVGEWRSGELGPAMPFLALEFCDGGTLSQKLRGTALPPRAAAELVAALARATQAAHHAGIIHRDLKPANVLLQTTAGVGPIPKISDFGLAKTVDADAERTALTASGALLGTPSYMAPEQAGISIGHGPAGDAPRLGPGVDIHALGAILYECLTGRPPFKAATPTETILQVLNHEPLPPSRLNSEAPRDLETICLKCLHKDPARRYGSAQELADDLQRFLAGEPIRARAVSWAERLVKWCKRRPAAAALAGSLGLFVVAVIAGAIWYLNHFSERSATGVREQARQEGIKREIDNALEDARRSRKELHEKLADPSQVHALLSDLDGWQGLIKRNEAASERARGLVQGNRDIVEPEQINQVEALGQQTKSDESDWQLAKDLDGIRADASTLVEGKFDASRAGPRYDQVFGNLGKEFAKENPDKIAAWVSSHRLRYALLASVYHWATVLPVDGWPALISARTRLLAVIAAAEEDDWGKQLVGIKDWQNRAAVETLARDLAVSRQSPQALIFLASALKKAGGDPVPLLRRALDQYPRDFWVHYELGTVLTNPVEQVTCFRAAVAIRPDSNLAHNWLGATLHNSKDLDQALVHYQKAIEVDPKNSWPYYNIGLILDVKKDLDGAMAHFKRAVAIDPGHAAAQNALGKMLYSKKQLADAIVHYKKAIKLDPNFYLAHTNLGDALREQKDLEGSAIQCQKLIELDPKNATGYLGLGNVLYDKKDMHGALAQYKLAVQLDSKNTSAHTGLGNTFRELKDLESAATHFRKAIDLDARLAFAHNGYGNVYWDKKDFNGAVANYRKALEIDPNLGIAKQNLANAYQYLGDALRDQKDLDGSAKQFRKLIELDPTNAMGYIGLGNALFDKRDLEAAAVQYAKATKVDPKNSWAHNSIGVTYFNQGRIDRAIVEYRNAIALDANNVWARNNLGTALGRKNDTAGAIAEYRKAVALDPKFAMAHFNLGHVYLSLDQFDDALKSAKLAQSFGYPVGALIKDCERLAALDQKSQSFLQGHADAKDANELVVVANHLADRKKQHSDAARLFAAAFQRKASLMDNVLEGYRYNAACCALLTAERDGKYAAKIDDVEKKKRRDQARQWLQADLDVYARALQAPAGEMEAMQVVRAAEVLPHWHVDSDLNSIRADKELARIAADEQAAWKKLWTEAALLLKKAQASFKTSILPGALTDKQVEAAHSFKMQGGLLYVIELNSGEFDAYLRLEEVPGKVLATNDNISKDNLNSRITITAPRDASYRIVATSTHHRGRGTYTVTIREFATGKKTP